MIEFTKFSENLTTRIQVPCQHTYLKKRFIKKSMIVGFWDKRRNISGMANFVNCSRTALVKVYDAKEDGTFKNQWLGKLRAINARGEWRLEKCVWANRLATVEPVTAQINQRDTKSTSSMTIQRTLLRMGLRSSRLANAHMLTAVH